MVENKFKMKSFFFFFFFFFLLVLRYVSCKLRAQRSYRLTMNENRNERGYDMCHIWEWIKSTTDKDTDPPLKWALDTRRSKWMRRVRAESRDHWIEASRSVSAQNEKKKICSYNEHICRTRSSKIDTTQLLYWTPSFHKEDLSSSYY